MVINGMYRHLKRRAPGLISRAGFKQTAVILALFGAAILIIWYFTNNGSQMSMLLMLMGTVIIASSIVLYFLSPYRYLRSEVCDSMVTSSILMITNMLSSFDIRSNAVYVPDKSSSVVKAFIPLSGGIDQDIANIVFTGDGKVLNLSSSEMKGISVIPPGHELFQNALGIGATFSPESLGNDISDVMENGLELAASTTVHRENNKLKVTMRDIANSGMCKAIRKESPKLCDHLGCPLCSFVSCMVASGTGMSTRIEKINVLGNTIELTYELI